MKELNDKIIELWHTSRAGGNISRYDRMIYVKNWLIKESADLIAGMSSKRIWFAIEDAIS